MEAKKLETRFVPWIKEDKVSIIWSDELLMQ